MDETKVPFLWQFIEGMASKRLIVECSSARYAEVADSAQPPHWHGRSFTRAGDLSPTIPSARMFIKGEQGAIPVFTKNAGMSVARVTESPE